MFLLPIVKTPTNLSSIMCSLRITCLQVQTKLEKICWFWDLMLWQVTFHHDCHSVKPARFEQADHNQSSLATLSKESHSIDSSLETRSASSCFDPTSISQIESFFTGAESLLFEASDRLICRLYLSIRLLDL